MENPDIPDKYCKEGPYIYDDGAFTLYLNRFGVWKTRNANGDGICSGLDKEDVVFWAREHINGFQNSWASTTNTKFGDGYKL